MILESTQLLFDAARQLGFEVPYKPCNPKHECCQWVLQDYQNFAWVRTHLVWLHARYLELSEKNYKSFLVFCRWNTDISNKKIIAAYQSNVALTLPFLAFSDGNEDLEQKYGHYIPNPNDKRKPYAVANSFLDATVAYQEYLRRKPYAQGLSLTFV